MNYRCARFFYVYKNISCLKFVTRVQTMLRKFQPSSLLEAQFF